MTLERAPRMTAYKERFQAGVASSHVHVEKADETETRISLGLQPQYMYKASGDCGVSQSNTFTEVLSLVFLSFLPLAISMLFRKETLELQMNRQCLLLPLLKIWSW